MILTEYYIIFTDMKRIRNAIVGLGRIGSLLEDDRLREKPCTHAGAVSLNPDCFLAAGCDIKKSRRDQFEKRWNCPQVYKNIGQMLKETGPDILHIATPPETHLEMVESALDHNVPVVICEKPLASTLDDAAEIASIQRSGKMTILTNHERRYSEDYIRIKSLIEKRAFGDLLSVCSKLYMGHETTLKTTLLHDGTHLVDTIHYLLSANLTKKSVYGSLEDETGTVFLHCIAKNIPVIIEIGGGRDHLVIEVDLSFSAGRIRAGNGLYEEYDSGPSPYYEHFNSLRKIKTPAFTRTGYFSNMLSDAVECFKDRARIPVSSAVNGCDAVSFILSEL
jgi:predicted dehydrogenase